MKGERGNEAGRRPDHHRLAAKQTNQAALVAVEFKVLVMVPALACLFRVLTTGAANTTQARRRNGLATETRSHRKSRKGKRRPWKRRAAERARAGILRSRLRRSCRSPRESDYYREAKSVFRWV